MEFQQRVIDEERELDERTEKLHVFIEDSPLFVKLDKAEQSRLRNQRYIMRVYRDILRERITSFERRDSTPRPDA